MNRRILARSARGQARPHLRAVLLIALLLISTGTSWIFAPATNAPATPSRAEAASTSNLPAAAAVVSTDMTAHAGRPVAPIDVPPAPSAPASGTNYQVLLIESGLSSGLVWNSSVTNTSTPQEPLWANNSDDTHVFYEPNGTYTYQVLASTLSWATPDDTGDFTVQGSPVNLTFPFQEVFLVSLNETELPSGGEWKTTVTNDSTQVSKTTHSGSTSHTYYEPNGSYGYQVSSDDAYYATPSASGTFTVRGSAVSLLLEFEHLYAVTVQESGLPLGTTWSAALKNSTGNLTTQSSANSLLTFSEPNGSYSYHVLSNLANYLVASPSGDAPFSVLGEDENLTATFAQLFHVTIYETGLPPASTWTATVGNSTFNVSSTSLRNFAVLLEPNGTYWYSGASSRTNYAPWSTLHYFAINGSSVNITVAFHQISGAGPPIPFRTWFLIAVAAAVAGAAMIAVVAARVIRRRRQPRPPPQPWEESAPEPTKQ
jgi:hypothetical protein